MTITLEDAALTELEQVLDTYRLSLVGVRVVCDTLPGRAICAAAVVDGVMLLVLDLDKPSAHRHAVAMLREWGAGRLADQPRQITPCSPVRAPMVTTPIVIPRPRRSLAAESVDVLIPRGDVQYPPRLVS